MDAVAWVNCSVVRGPLQIVCMAFNGAEGGFLGPLLYGAAKCFLLQISSHLRWHVRASFAGSLSLSLFFFFNPFQTNLGFIGCSAFVISVLCKYFSFNMLVCNVKY